LNGDQKTHGIEEASSAMDAATHMTNMHAMGHAHTIAKWPPEEIGIKFLLSRMPPRITDLKAKDRNIR
jgi:hypothetical protein